ILLGVNMAQVRPQKTDFIAFHQLIASILLLRYFHLTISIAQFINIIITTRTSVPRTVHRSMFCNKVLNSWRFCWLLILEMMNHFAYSTMDNLIHKLRYFFFYFFNYSNNSTILLILQ